MYTDTVPFICLIYTFLLVLEICRSISGLPAYIATDLSFLNSALLNSKGYRHSPPTPPTTHQDQTIPSSNMRKRANIEGTVTQLHEYPAPLIHLVSATSSIHSDRIAYSLFVSTVSRIELHYKLDTPHEMLYCTRNWIPVTHNLATNPVYMIYVCEERLLR